MPSMHISSSFDLITVLAITSDRIFMKTAYYGAATFVGLYRAYKNEHWSSGDILGAALVVLCGRVAIGCYLDRSRVALATATYESGTCLALVDTW